MRAVPAAIALLVALPVGCAPPPAPGDSSPPAADTAPAPSTWDYSGEGEPDGALDATSLAEALALTLERIPTTDPLVFMDVYGHQLALATGGCPTFDPAQAGQLYWSGDCTSDRGATFHGWALFRWDHNVPDGSGGTCLDLAFYFGFARILNPDGTVFDGWGSQAYDDCVQADGTRTIIANVTGEYAYDGAPGTWLDAWVPEEVTWTSSWGPDTASVVVEGGLSGLEGDVYAVRLDALTFDRAAACPAEPDGAVRLWDTSGAEYVVTFDGSGECDGCGDATTGDRHIGAVCADFTPWTAWEERPWWD